MMQMVKSDPQTGADWRRKSKKPEMRECAHCRRLLYVHAFETNPKTGNLYSTCRECRRQASNERRPCTPGGVAPSGNIWTVEELERLQRRA